MIGASTNLSGSANSAIKRVADKENMKYLGTIKQLVSEGTPLEVAECLNNLEDFGDIEIDDDISQEDVPEGVELLEMDSEIDLFDEDEGYEHGDFWAEVDDDMNESSLFASRRFEIVVSDTGSCHVERDAQYRRKNHSSTGQQALYTLNSRLDVLRKIADWLTNNRGEFLRKCDPWYLGCDALEEIKGTKIPIIQKSFIKCAGLEISEETFSRYIRTTGLYWTDGRSGCLGILFSDEAKKAWVANAVKQFCIELGTDTRVVLPPHSNVIVGTKEHESLKKRSVKGITLPVFIKKACSHAGSTWKDVYSQYRERIQE